MAEVKNYTDAFEIVVDDGYRKIPIRNLSGEPVGVFYFHPTDIGIVNRFNAFADKFDDILKPLENVDIDANGEASDTDDAQMVSALKDAEKNLYEALDTVIGGNMSEAFFGKMHPFSPVDGKFYCEVALEAVGAFISKQFEAETKKIDKRIGKYTKGLKRK